MKMRSITSSGRTICNKCGFLNVSGDHLRILLENSMHKLLWRTKNELDWMMMQFLDSELFWEKSASDTCMFCEFCHYGVENCRIVKNKFGPKLFQPILYLVDITIDTELQSFLSRQIRSENLLFWRKSNLIKLSNKTDGQIDNNVDFPTYQSRFRVIII